MGETCVIVTPCDFQWLTTSVRYWAYAGIRLVMSVPPQLLPLEVIVVGYPCSVLLPA